MDGLNQTGAVTPILQDDDWRMNMDLPSWTRSTKAT
jgi:hypothetical protein